MDALFFSTLAVAMAEMGDKTQLLAFILASRFKKPLPIILGITVATIFNHSLAGALGTWITNLVGPEALKWILAASFVAMGLWILVPDKDDDLKKEKMDAAKLGVFGLTTLTFFLAEMGDKTQIATVALVAHYNAPVEVVCGTTLGMLIADVPAVFFGNKLAEKIPMKWLRIGSAVLFIGIGIFSAFGVGFK